MKSDQSVLKLQPHISRKKNEKYNGMFLCDNRKSVIGQKMLIKSVQARSKLTAQMVFNNPQYLTDIISYYTVAAGAWGNSLNQVQAFVNTYNGDLNFSNKNMEKNMVNKSVKAATTCAGESYEPYRWRQGNNNNYYGPGADFGVDIKKYVNSLYWGATGKAAEEVKSSKTIFWRSLFYGTPDGVRRVAYLSGPALTDAQTNTIPGVPRNRRYYIYYDKANPRMAPAICL